MIALFKSEFSYNFTAMLWGWFFPIVLALILVGAGVDIAYLIVLGSSTVAVIIYVVVSGVQAEAEKQVRRVLLLPVSVQTAAFVQILLYLIFMAGMAAIWFVTWAAAPAEPLPDALLRIITYACTLNCWIFFFWAVSDLKFSGNRPLKILFPLAVALLLALLLVSGYRFDIRLVMLPSFNGTTPVGPSELAGTMVLMAGLVTAQFRFFIQRRSFLQ
ncbi:hypothetical protein JXO52_00700 [bacterium]|nr:hypothetical protein [bacterium]